MDLREYISSFSRVQSTDGAICVRQLLLEDNSCDNIVFGSVYGNCGSTILRSMGDNQKFGA
jgi:hypothetical protein